MYYVVTSKLQIGSVVCMHISWISLRGFCVCVSRESVCVVSVYAYLVNQSAWFLCMRVSWISLCGFCVCVSRESVCVVSVYALGTFCTAADRFYILHHSIDPAHTSYITSYIDWKWLMIYIYQFLTKYVKINLKKAFYLLLLTLSYISVYLHIPDNTQAGRWEGT